MKRLREIVPTNESKEIRHILGAAVIGAGMIGGAGMATDHIMTQKRRADNVAYMKVHAVNRPETYPEVSALTHGIGKPSKTPVKRTTSGWAKGRMSDKVEDRRIYNPTDRKIKELKRKQHGASGSW